MQWCLPFDWNYSSKLIHFNHSSFFSGSCFAQNIAAKMEADRFSVFSNPYGILYNPISIAESLQFILGVKEFSKGYIFQYQNLFFSQKHHSSTFGSSPNELLQKIDEQNQQAAKELQASSFVFVTLGSAKTYTHTESGNLVANCHKLPSNLFQTSYLSVQEIASIWEPILEQMPEKQFIFSLSPVRYVREGLVQSNYGKSVLRIAIESLCARFPNVHYFPAYELVIDVLREYRFYKEDLVHPNDTAIDYVYGFLSEKIFTDEAKIYKKEAQALRRMLEHKVMQVNSPEAELFEKKKMQSIQDFEAKWGDASRKQL